MSYVDEIKRYVPKNEQELQDKNVILDCIQQFPQNILLRDNEIAHITSSGFILNKSLDKALFIHHNIRDVWAWTGGHADGDSNLLDVATREAVEETSVSVTPISREIASVDILTVTGHFKSDKYINSHLHLSIAYLFTANESDSVCINPDENSGVEWFPIDEIVRGIFTDRDVYLYTKLIQQARIWALEQFR
ncbi:MAG: NUDIX hydrolase [Defluviitaleaceae bacterium]|nr:NUDIX hydrolase [Defluviitaleaceae bacterium]